MVDRIVGRIVGKGIGNMIRAFLEGLKYTGTIIVMIMLLSLVLPLNAAIVLAVIFTLFVITKMFVGMVVQDLNEMNRK